MVVAGEHVGVQCCVCVAEDLVVYPERGGACVERFADERHVGQEPGPAGIVEIGETIDNRIGQQQRTVHRPLALADGLVDRGARCRDGQGHRC
jgi:hypothetical protein